MLNPQQKQYLNNFNGLDNKAQAQKIADLCNEKGITKEQLAQIINQIK